MYIKMSIDTISVSEPFESLRRLYFNFAPQIAGKLFIQFDFGDYHILQIALLISVNS